MKQLLKSTIKKYLETKVAITSLTDKKDIEELLYKLHPVSVSGKELIRFGGKGDGGYLIPDDLEGIEACFSPGVDQISQFEKDCADRGMKVFLADKSVDKPAEEHDLFHFTKKYLGILSNDDFMTLDDWVDNSISNKDSDLLLQMDIEGGEYDVFLSASNPLMKRFRTIVVEYHWLNRLWDSSFFYWAKLTFNKILQTHYCVHIHPNNCSYPIKRNGLDIPPIVEFTFLRKDRIEDFSYQKQFPHPLDYDNVPDNQHYVLPDCWYRK
jgi:hypothetical protein